MNVQHDHSISVERERERNGLQAIVGFKSCLLPEDLCVSQRLF